MVGAHLIISGSPFSMQEIDPCDHSNCCDALPPIFEPNSAGADGVEILWNDNDSLSPNSLGGGVVVGLISKFTASER